MADTNDMIRKIQACLNLANDPGASEAEKALAQSRAESLMVKYEIDEAMMFVEAKGTTKEKDVVMTSFWVFGVGETFIPRPRMSLVGVIGRNMSCRGVIEEKHATVDEMGEPLPGGTYYTLVGFRSDVENAKALYGLLVVDIAMAIAGEKQTGRNYVNEFATGYVTEIDVRLGEMRRNVTKAVEDDGRGMGLVLVKKGELVKDEFQQRFPKLVSYTGGPRASTYDGNARGRGAEAARKADLGGGAGRVGSSSGIGRKRLGS